MKFYSRERVEGIEQSPEFKTAFARSASRRTAARIGVVTKKEQLLAAISSIDIVITRVPLDSLYRKACDSYNRWHKQLQFERELRGDTIDFVPATPDSDESFLTRITVNYLRHKLRSYEKGLEVIYGKVGVTEAYIELNAKIYGEIADVYPEFAEECWRQQAQKKERIEYAKTAQERAPLFYLSWSGFMRSQ
jgi:hypothetical protein